MRVSISSEGPPGPGVLRIWRRAGIDSLDPLLRLGIARPTLGGLIGDGWLALIPAEGFLVLGSQIDFATLG